MNRYEKALKRCVESEEVKQTLKKLLYETAMNCLDSIYIGQHPSDTYADIANNRVDTWVDLVPTADVRENVHGKWLVIEDELWEGGGRYECSVCGYGFAFGAFHEMDEQHYCPNCGATMDGE